MNHKNTFAVSFYQRVDKIDDKKTAPVFMRVTVSGKRADISINRRVHTDNWEDGRAKGKSQEAKQLNLYLESLKAKVYNIQRDLVDRKEPITAEKVKKIFQGKGANDKTLVQVFEYHNEQMRQLIGKDFSVETWHRYETTLKHVKEFMLHQYKVKDLYLHEVRYEFVTSFEFYLKTVRSCAHNSTLKYILNFRKIISLALKNEWLDKDPFKNYSNRLEEVDRGFLSKEELAAIEQKNITIPRLAVVRNIFIFSCYTGLSYAEVAKLSLSNIVLGIDGEKWIHIRRTKTDVKSTVPLLPKALDIIERYKEHHSVQGKDKLLPVMTNQKMNAYLKELGDICGISKVLTYHLARHTFATTVTLTNGVPIESVSAMLGHKSIKTTQIYAKVVEQKVGTDMAALKQKLMDDAIIVKQTKVNLEEIQSKKAP
ncbi:MAG: site-specific integrase [Bacteroidales bacterium]|nr:site-specific integrase [Bacteroidales bacterium]